MVLGRAVAMRSCRGARCSAALLLIVLLTAGACGRESILDKATKEYEAGRYREAVFLIRHHVKMGGEASPALLFLFGKAWLKAGGEAEAQSAFEDCRKKDASYGRGDRGSQGVR